MILRNRIAEAISLLSIEVNADKRKEHEETYEILLKELNEFNRGY